MKDVDIVHKTLLILSSEVASTNLGCEYIVKHKGIQTTLLACITHPGVIGTELKLKILAMQVRELQS